MLDRRSPFVRNHEAATTLSRTSVEILGRMRKNLLVGERGMKWPAMALHSQTQMTEGPVRHALSQMVVAGTMVVHPPFMTHAGAETEGA
jgi:hypothetical protein